MCGGRRDGGVTKQARYLWAASRRCGGVMKEDGGWRRGIGGGVCEAGGGWALSRQFGDVAVQMSLWRVPGR
jgi:hypothetical protein